MPTWVKAPNIVAIQNSFNKIAPNRDKSSDGTIGDLAHQSGTSGHNPDDYPGVRAERSDSDNIPEVRAVDIDVDLKLPGVTMEMVVQSILRSTDKNRLIYIIYNGRIWSKSNGWKQQTYTGKNKHTQHAHFSGDAASDNDSRPWPSIEVFGGEEDDMFCKLGDKGEKVQAVQYALNMLGFEAGAEDGDYGPGTSAAVLRMRKSLGSGVPSGDVFDAHAYVQLLICLSRKFGPVTEPQPTTPAPAPVIQLPMNVTFTGTIDKA